MATQGSSSQAGYEHVERLEPSGPIGATPGVDTTLEHPPPPRQRTRPSSGRPRPVSMPPVAASDAVNGQPAPEQTEQRSQQHSSSRRGTSRATVRVIGSYSLGKTLGAGSMGKVKLAYHNQTGEKLAIKIVPRPSGQHSNQGNPTASFLARQAAKDASKEIRTVREAALSMILFHPYICGTREIIAQPNYHYIVFEFVNGGQMLDYIISHGRLRERVARKFARQIGSSLEYLHKNSVVHRDLKIENILISESGNIKIIDFGLSNLFNPASHLSTFCGSLYFAAPELLNAKAYTGPEVDIWSFGVVLYVLVCGKVPFDDQHMPALHAKIKRGIVDYPNWLSAECKHILSRMLVVVPGQRAPLSEVLNHPWMLRGFSGPPDPHLLPREPLKASELDPAVVAGMHGFEFGTVEEIGKKLYDVLETDAYKRMVDLWERKQNPNGTNGYRATGESPSSSLTAINQLSNSPSPGDTPGSTRKGSKRFSGLGFDYYRRKFFNQGNSPPGTPTGKSPMSAMYGPQATAVMDSHRMTEYVDPCFGFHPLISIYFLVREKMERERVYGPHFASSQISLNPPQPQPQSSRTEEPVTFKVPNTNTPPPSSFKATPGSTGTNTPTKAIPVIVAPPSAATKGSYDMPLPRLPAPEASHQPGTSYDTPVPRSPANAAHPQPRTLASDLPVEMQGTGSPPPSSYAGMPAAPKAAEKHQHRRSTSLTNRAALMAGWVSGGREKVSQAPRTAGPEHTTFDEKVEVEPRRSEHVARERDDGRISPAATAPPSSTHASSHKEGGSSSIRRITTMLGNRLSEDSKKTLGRRGSLLKGAFSLPRHSVDVTSRSMKEKGAMRPKSQEEVMSDAEVSRSMTDAEQTRSVPISTSQSHPTSNLHRRAQTIVDSQSRESKHIRRGSLGAGFALGTIGRRPKTAAAAAPAAVEKMPEEDEARTVAPNDSEGEGILVNKEDSRVEAAADDDGSATERDVKPLYLKGLFSVATTTTRPVNVIKNDIRNVLNRMQIHYREVKGGFECIHAPSIDLASLQQEGGNGGTTGRFFSREGSNANSQGPSASSTMRRGVVRKASKLSFATVRKKDKAKDSESIVTPTTATTPHPSVSPSTVMKAEEKDLPSRPSVSTTAGDGTSSHPPVAGGGKPISPSAGSSSFFNVPSGGQSTADTEETVNGRNDAKASIDKGKTPSVRTQDTGGDAAAQEVDVPEDLVAASTVVPEEPIHQTAPGSSTTPTREKFLPPIPRDFAETPVTPSTKTTAAPEKSLNIDELFQASGTSDLIVRFEIMVVKVPLLPLHGIQFRRIGGDGWQYQMLARRVLTELRL